MTKQKAILLGIKSRKNDALIWVDVIIGGITQIYQN